MEITRTTTIFLLVISLAWSCRSSKNISDQSNGQIDPIQIAIRDFERTKRLYKQSSVFSVSEHEFINRKDFLIIRVGANNSKLLLTSAAKVGSKGKLPSRFIERDGKLFFWWDDDYPLSEEALRVFGKYNLLQDDENGAIKIPDRIIHDAEKAAHYYFCRNNLNIYKKVITSRGMGNYDPPRLPCNNQ